MDKLQNLDLSDRITKSYLASEAHKKSISKLSGMLGASWAKAGRRKGRPSITEMDWTPPALAVSEVARASRGERCLVYSSFCWQLCRRRVLVVQRVHFMSSVLMGGS